MFLNKSSDKLSIVLGVIADEYKVSAGTWPFQAV